MRSSMLRPLRKSTIILPLGALLAQITATRAFASGYSPTQDWLDNTVLSLIPVVVVLFGLSAVLKPAGVPLNQMYRAPWKGFPKLIFWATKLSFFALMGMIFTSMFMDRM